MALDPSSVTRATDSAGDEIATLKGSVSGKEYQQMVLVDDAEAQLGITANPLEVQASAGLAVTEAVPASSYNSATAENFAQVSNGAATLREITAVLDTGASARWLHLFDSTTALAGGETPVMRLPLPAGPSAVAYAPAKGRAFATGIQAATSSTFATYTDPGDTVAVFHADYD